MSPWGSRWQHGCARVEEALLGLRSFEQLHVPRASALTIVCDDGHVNDWNHIAPLLADYGARATFAVVSARVGQPECVDRSQLEALVEAGHEIACHGRTHVPLPALADTAALEAELGGALAWFRAAGIATSTLVYPYGQNNRAVRAWAASLFRCGVGTWFGQNGGLTNRYAIRRIPFGSFVNVRSASEAYYRGLIERSSAGACWTVLMLHPGAVEHTAAHNALLGRLIRYARELQLPVRTVAEHLDT